MELNKTINSSLVIDGTSYDKIKVAKEKFDQDDYSIEIASKKYILVIDFHKKCISGEVIADGEWGKIDSFEYLPLALIVDASYATIRPYDELFYKENNQQLLRERLTI